MTDTASAHDHALSDDELDGRRALTSAVQALTCILQNHTPLEPLRDDDDLDDARTQLLHLEDVLVEIEHILSALAVVDDASPECRRIEGATSMAVVLAERARAEMTARLDEAQT